MTPARGRLYLGAGDDGPRWAPPEQSVLVLGPPRSGKTSSLVVPTILGADGPVVSTSTKPDVLEVTAPARSRAGDCLLFDPSGTVGAPEGVAPVRWSPVPACRRWDDAMLVAAALVGAGRSPGAAPTASHGDHWQERAEALLAPLLHAAALSDLALPTLLSWVDRRQPAHALAVLDDVGASVPADLLAGIVATDPREQSGIWSTASGVLAGYRSEAALDCTLRPNFDASAFCRSDATLYICASARHQAQIAPMVVGLLTEIRAAAYAEHARALSTGDRRPTPLVLALDEVANIAPLPDLPAMISEGGGQGVLTMACLQDLSQARTRWGQAADGFLSLFGTTVVLPGIGDVRTLEALSALAGQHDVLTRSVTAPVPMPTPGVTGALTRLALGTRGRRTVDDGRPTVTVSSRREPRMAVDAIGRGRPGMAVTVDDRNTLGWLRLTPWFAHEPWRALARTPALELGRSLGR